VKRPILALLAAVTLSFGVVGTAPARAATPDSTTAAVPTPAHHHHHDWDHDGYDGGHRHHPRDYDGDYDGDRDGRHRRQCAGLIVVCL
jgi:hypothetical protein